MMAGCIRSFKLYKNVMRVYVNVSFQGLGAKGGRFNIPGEYFFVTFV